MMWWVVLFILLSGCTTFYQNAVEDAATQYKNKIIANVGDFDLEGDEGDLEIGFNQTDSPVVYAFVCNNSKIPTWKRYWYYLISKFNRKYLFDPPLLGGECWIEEVGKLPSLRAVFMMANLTEQEILDNALFKDLETGEVIPEVRDNPKWYERIYTFGLAAGPTFADFNNLNPYCNSSLRYSIKFIRGTQERYILPIAPEKRAACYLDLSVIPTYVFHGEGGFPRADNAWELAKTLYSRGEAEYEGKGIGPVVLVTESSLTKDNYFDYTYYADGSRSSLRNVELAFAQAQNLKSECPTCLVALYIPLGINLTNKLWDGGGGENDLDWIRSQFLDNNYLNESVDIIAFGLDVNELDNPCSWEEMLFRMNQMIDFAKSLGKMSYVIYVNYPLNESCRVDNRTYTLGYGSGADMLFWNLFRMDPASNNQYRKWVGKGLMALSLPPLYPLSGQQAFGACENCSLIYHDVIWQPTQPIFSYVLDFCQNYSVNGYTFPVVFSPSNNFFNLGLEGKDSYYYSNISPQTTVIKPAKEYTLSDKDAPLFMCTGCFLQLTEDELRLYRSTFDLAAFEGSCDEPKFLIDDLRIYAEILDVDLPYLRALIDATSRYDGCYVSQVPRSRQAEKCGYSLTWEDLEAFVSRNGYSCEFERTNYEYESDKCVNGASGEECVPCGLGVMDVKGLLPDERGECGLYDPFDPTSNMCEGMYKVGEALDKARTLLSSNLNLFFGVEEGEGALTADQNTEYTILWMMMGAIYYNGEGEALEKAVEWYRETREWSYTSGSCSGITQELCCPDNPYGICGSNVKFWDFLKGLEEAAGDSDNREIFEVYTRTRFGLIVMSKYFDAYQKCDDCTNAIWGENIDARLCQVNPEFCERR